MPTIQSFIEQVHSATTLNPVTVLAGPEHLLISRSVDAIRNACVGEAILGLNADVFEGKGTRGDAVVAAANTVPMMAERRFVLVRNADALDNDALAAIASYLDDPNPATCLVLTATKLDGRSKLVRAAKKKDCFIEAKSIRGHGLRDFVRGESKRRGHAISQVAVESIVNAIGENLALLDDAIERLSLFAGPGQRIDETMVESCVSRVRGESIWALVDSISVKDQARAMHAASSLLADREPPLRLLAMVARQLRMIARMRQSLAQGLAPDEAARAAGAPPFKARDLTRAAQRFNAASLGHAFEVVSLADRSLKGSKRPPAVIFQQAVLELSA